MEEDWGKGGRRLGKRWRMKGKGGRRQAKGWRTGSNIRSSVEDEIPLKLLIWKIN